MVVYYTGIVKWDEDNVYLGSDVRAEVNRHNYPTD